MKKLTAGIFATLLAVVSADSAYAAIASQGYVDDKVEAVETTVAGKADSSTVTALGTRVGTAEGEIDTLQTTTGQHTSQIGTINTTLSKKLDSDTAASTYQTLANSATKTELAAKQDKLTQTGSANQPVYVDATGKVTAGNTIPTVTTNITAGQTGAAQAGAVATALAAKANTADLGDLATLDAVGSAQITDGAVATDDIASKAVTKEKLADEIVTSLGKADSALQKTTADTTYAVKALESQVGTVSKENMGTTTATTVVGGVKEAIDAAKAADTKATNATSAASAAQSAVDAVEATIGGYGDIVTHDVSEFATAAQGTKADTAVQPAAISDMLTKTEAGTTYYTKTSGDALAGRVTTAEGEIDAIQAEMDTMATSQTVTNLTNRVATAEGDITALETAVNDAESGLAATNAIADEALANAATAQSAAEAAQTVANSKLPTATYNTQVGSVSAANMGTTATTVVAAIKEVAGEASTAQSTATAAQQTATQAQQTANAAIPAPSDACADPDNKCVLVSSGAGNYSWEVIARGDEE